MAEQLVHTALADHPTERDITLLAVSMSNLVRQQALQLELPVDTGCGTGDDQPPRPGSDIGAHRWAVDQAMDRVRSRFGGDSVGYLSVALSEHSRVPDEFRELAEHDL
jgi:DNA polymerase-4